MDEEQKSPAFSTSSDEVPKGYNWGAFWLTWVWGIGHGIWVSLLVIILHISLIVLALFIIMLGLSGFSETFFTPLYLRLFSFFPSIQSMMYFFITIVALMWILYFSINFLFGLKGNKWAWNRKKGVSNEIFSQGEKIWLVVAWIVVGIPVILNLIFTLVTFPWFRLNS